MKYKKSQSIMMWFLPLIVIGGLFNPFLGYLVLAAVVFLLTLSFFKGRYWCWNLCPRGSFLDIALARVSRNKAVPRVFVKQWFRLAVFVLFIGLVGIRIARAGGNQAVIGAVFVGACLSSTVLAVVLGVTTKHRVWCVICPMGFLQEKISKLKK